MTGVATTATTTQAEAAADLAAMEVAAMWQRPSIEDRAEGVVTFAVLADALLAALRRLAQEDRVVRTISPA